MRLWPVSETVTIPDHEDISSEGIQVDRILAYGAAAVPAPANLWGLAFTPSRVVEAVKLRTVEGEWVTL